MKFRLGGRPITVVVGLVALALVATAAVTGAVGPLEDPSGDAVLDRVHQRYESAETLTSTATVTVENDTASTTATIEMAATADNRSRAIVERDGRTYRLGSNGSVVWAVGPDRSAAWPIEALATGEHEAVAGAAGADPASWGDHTGALSAQGTPTLNDSNVSATVVGTPAIDGTGTYELELTSPELDGSASLWVARDDYRVVRASATDGTTRTVVDVESTAFNVSIHDSTFEPPADRVSLSTFDQYDEFAAAQTATDLQIPQLDERFAEATVTVRQGETIVAQRYRRDGGNVTLVSTSGTDRFDSVAENASTRTIDGQTVAVTTVEDRALAAWSDDDVTTVVAVEGSTDRAVDVATELLG